MLVCFDLDDTLLDHSGAERAAALHFGAHLGARSPHAGEVFVMAWRAAAQRHMAAFLRGDISFQEGRRRRVQEVLGTELAALGEAELDELFAVYLEAYQANWRLFEDVAGCLAALRPYKLGVISNGSQAQGLEKLAQLGILHHFSFVLSAEAAGCAKPDPVIFRQAQARSSCAASSCIYIGDQLETDVEAAAHAGWRSVWLDRGAVQRPEHPSTLTSLREFPAWLERETR
jgi:putative hydrolase of the HAD superfamily